MLGNAATLKIAIEVDDKGTVKIRQLGKASQDAGEQADKGFRRAGKSLGDFDQVISGTVAKLGKVLAVTLAAAAAAGAAALVMVSRQAVQLASDLEETQNKFDVVFRGMTGQAEAWAKVLQDSYIMTREESKRYLASIQDLLVPMGMAREEAGKMSFEIVKLSADMGSFNNIPTAQVMADIQSALVGNYETMKKYGVVLNERLVQEKALAMGLAATKDEVTAADKAQAAYQLILAGSADAIGDIERSSESYANQMRLLSVNVTELKTTLGEALLPVLAKMLVDLNNWIKANEGLLRQNITAFAEKLVPILQNTAKAIGWIVEQIDNWIEGAKILGIIEESAAVKTEQRIRQLRAEITTHREIAGNVKVLAENRLYHAQLLMEKEAELQRLLGNTRTAEVEVGSAAEASGEVQVQAAGQATAAVGRNVQEVEKLHREYVAAAKGITDNWQIQHRDRHEVQSRALQRMVENEDEALERMGQAVDDFYGDIYDKADDHTDGVKQLNELLVNDMGRIFDSYINDVLHGQIRSVKDLFEGLFKSILDMFARLLSQMAANSLVDALFGKGDSGGLTLSSLTSGGGLLSKVLGGGSLAESAGSAGKWVAGLLGIGGSAAAPALLGGGSVGVAAYPAVGVATSGTGYAVGMGGMGAGGAATTGAGATTTSGGSMALGFAPWMAPAAVGAIGLGLWAKFVFGDKKPTTTELMNQMALKPEDYAFAIGTAFSEAMDPVYEIPQRHMMNAQGTALTTWNQFETEFRDVQTRIYDHTTGQWQDLAYSGQVLFAMMRGDVVSEMDAMAMEVETGIAGLAEQLVSASEQMQTGLDKARNAMQDMGVSGGYLKQAMDLASRSLESAGQSTDGLRDYLEGLGLSADDVNRVMDLLKEDMDTVSAATWKASSGIGKLVDGLGGLYDAVNEQIAIPPPTQPAGQQPPDGAKRLEDIIDLSGKGAGGSLGGYMTSALSLPGSGKGSFPMDPKVGSTYISGPPFSTVRSGDAATIGPFMQDILFKMAQLGRTGLDKELAALNFEMRRVTKQAREMGASEKDLYDIERYYKQLRDAAAAEYQRKEEERARKLTEHIGTIDEQLAALTMSDKDKAIAATVRQMEAAIEKAVELGASEADLAKIRELQLKQEEEIRTRGLRDAIEEMRRFRESLADTADTAGRSAQAQRQLMEILAQAREGDFSGVEAIGDVLRDISINKADYATAADYARAYWSVMHAVADIEKLASAKVPGFADGGDFIGGWRVVGERGPELEYTGPSRIYNRAQAGELINIDDLVVEVRELRREVSAGNYQVAKNTGKTARHVERWEAIGMPQERVA